MSSAPSVWQPLEENEWQADRFVVGAWRSVGGPFRLSIECESLEDQLPSMSMSEARKLLRALEKGIDWAEKRGGK